MYGENGKQLQMMWVTAVLHAFIYSQQRYKTEVKMIGKYQTEMSQFTMHCSADMDSGQMKAFIMPMTYKGNVPNYGRHGSETWVLRNKDKGILQPPEMIFLSDGL